MQPVFDVVDLMKYEVGCHQPLVPGRGEPPRLFDDARPTQSVGLDAEVEDLFGRREAVLEVDSVNVANLLAEPDIEGIL